MLLPLVERLFGVTTGMTLSEWRDPRQPLLKKLQLQAPGTYNHSHTVATLAEAAAEAIGADGLHVYVGALYHDIGKMNKPDYFVENQPRGFNRHTKLSPAMSLLVIVGHVKDGAELAREYGLPRSLHGYINTHHGTTLVEYFYDQARRQAEEGDDEPLPAEVEYRYPGPKPQTREQAILMVCDAVESATRALGEPTPGRIQSLVHTICSKRLTDGQFDDCELTLAELSKIEEAVTRALTSIYHGRVAYPTVRGEEEDEREGSGERRAERAG
jgi:putative nucleotidyltransferase with HDIG domain